MSFKRANLWERKQVSGREAGGNRYSSSEGGRRGEEGEAKKEQERKKPHLCAKITWIIYVHETSALNDNSKEVCCLECGCRRPRHLRMRQAKGFLEGVWVFSASYLRERPAGFVLTPARWLHTLRRCRPPAQSCTLCRAADLRCTETGEREGRRRE